MNELTKVDSLTSHAIQSAKIGHVTITIEEIERNVAYEVYAVTEKQGKRLIDTACSLREAQLIAESEAKLTEKLIASRRKKKPTARQLITLFDMKIPIPVTLTFGQASDLIGERIEANREKKRSSIHLMRAS